MEVVYRRAFVFRRRARQRWPNGVSQSGGKRWEMSQIGCCLLPRVLLLPIRHRAGAHPPPRTRCAPPHPPPISYAPASRPLLARFSLLMPAPQRQAASSHASSSSGIRNDVDNDLTMSSALKRHRTAGYREKKVYNHVLEQK